MNLQRSIALAVVLALAGCRNEPPAAPPSPAQPARTPTPDAQAPAATAQAAPKLPTAADLIALIDRATRIEAKSAGGKQPAWSKELTKADIDNLKAGIGQAELDPHAPRCLPTVVVTLFQQDKVLATLGGFCDGGQLATAGPMRFEIDKTIGSFIPQDRARINAALAAPRRK